MKRLANKYKPSNNNIKKGLSESYSKLIGNDDSIYQNNGTPNYIYTPLIFWFCKDISKSIPLVSLMNSKLNINTRTNKLENLIYFQDWEKYYNEIISQENLDYIITGHHQNDDHETFLLNTIKGSGIKGLKGIPAKNGIILRPALQFTKSRLLEYVKHHKINIGIDSSNLVSKYERNYLRNEVFNKIGMSQEDQDIIYNLILSTKVPQQPKTHLEEILCDADLDYLGRNDFEDISSNLLKELEINQKITNFNWLKIQEKQKVDRGY